MRIEIIEVESCQKCRHRILRLQWAMEWYSTTSANDVGYCSMFDRTIHIGDVWQEDKQKDFPGWCKLEEVEKKG